MRLLCCLCVSAALAASAGIASADTINLDSYGQNQGTTSFTPGVVGNSALAISGGTSYDLPNTAPWTPAGAGSSWVAQNPGDEPSGGHVEANGVYTFTSTFTLTSANYAGSIDVMADDTVAVYLNGNLVQQFAGGSNGECQVNQPNCITPLSVDLPLSDFVSGLNTLTFDVHQTNLQAEGVDFYGSITSTPEPNSLLLLGTGLLAIGGFFYRRRVQI